jgi:hypothetical protein
MVRASGDRCIYANSSVTQGRDVDGSAFQHGGKSHVQGRLHNEDLLYRGSTHWDSVLAEVCLYDLRHADRLMIYILMQHLKTLVGCIDSR